MEDKYWYGLKSDVYVRICGNKALIYDTKQKICRISEDIHVVNLLRSAEEDNSLGCVLIDEKRESHSVIEWIKSTYKEGLAVMFPYRKGEGQPMILRPLLSLNKDVDKIKDNELRKVYAGREIKHLLNSLVIYLNNNCKHYCHRCNDYFKQIAFCTNYGKGSHDALTAQQLDSILTAASSFAFRYIDIFGGDIYDEKQLRVLKKYATPLNLMFRFHIHYEVYQTNEFIDSQNVQLLVPHNFDMMHLEGILKHLEGTDYGLHFIVENDEDLGDVEDFVRDKAITSYQIHPFYTGQNEAFFIDHVYLEKEDLMHSELCMREIFRNQKLNANNFGTLYIMPDGSIKAHLQRPTLGFVGKDELIDMIYKELVTNTAWRQTREGEPCSQCVFQYLCPPPSNYESVIGKNNLCYLHNNKIHV